MNQVFLYKSPIGLLEIQLQKGLIYSLYTTPKMHKKNSTALKAKHSETTIQDTPKMHPKNPNQSGIKHVVDFLDHYFACTKKLNQHKKPKASFSLFPRGTAFQQKVWSHLITIPYGRTQSYNEVAKAIGSAPRAVGSACAKNPYLIVVPCHRVVSQTGLGGFALGHSIKKFLIAHERRTAAGKE